MNIIKYLAYVIMMVFMSCTTKTSIDSHDKIIKEDNATLIVMAYPEEVVKTTEALYSQLLPLIGIGKKNYARGGHACMVLIRDGSSEYEYFDFGRYISPEGYARARGANTDPETIVEVKAVWEKGKLANIEELLMWLYNHPEKTRGYGDLYASISEKVNYEIVKKYIAQIQDKGILKYGPFQRGGSNCSRFVTDAMLNGILDVSILERVDDLYYFTPSVLGNVEAANSYDYYYVATKDSVYKSSANLMGVQKRLLFDKGEGYDHVTDCQKGKLIAPDDQTLKGNPHWLGGIGYGVWYQIESTDIDRIYSISQISAYGTLMWSTLFKGEYDIDLTKPYKIVYPSHYACVTICIDQIKYTLERMGSNML